MNEKYLDKVLNQIVDETKIDSEGRVITHICQFSPLHPSFHPSFFLHFYNHCIDIYGLTEDEIHYLWEKYNFIIDKIKNG